MKMTLFIKLACTIFVTLTTYTQAFVSTRSSNRLVTFYGRNGLSKVSQVESSLVAFAKKKRRRKNSQINEDLKVTPKPSVTSEDENEDEDFLPDFDLDEEAELSSASSGDIANIPAKSQSSFDLNDPKVLEAMKGTSKGRGVPSMNDLVVDRDLEKRFQFDSSVVKDQSLPTNLANIAKNPDRKKIGKKAARTEARRRAAVEAKEAEEESESFFSKFSLGQKDGEFSYLKLVEQGTWACIYALIAWEVYLNTPLFSRAGPLAPVVYSSPSELFII